MKALDSLYKTRSQISLVGNHLNIHTGQFTATDAGIGAGIDSYFEYLVKGGLLFQRPELIDQFYEYEKAINTYVRKGDWFTWVSYDKGQVSLPVFQSLEAFWPGILVLLGKVEDASRILLTYTQVLEQLGLPPEFYNIPNRETMPQRAGYPLRPEMAESLMYLYKATEDPTYLHIAAGMVETIDQVSKTSCGFATIKDVNTFTLEDRMESFFLAETVKYLYLIFDPDNFMHNHGMAAKLIETTNGPCLIEAGGYFYNTEAHPIDPGILYCCSLKHQYDTKSLEDLEETLDIASMIGLDLQSNDNEHLNVHEERFYTLKNDVQMKDIDEDISETMLENTASNSHLVTEELKLHQDSLSNSSENIAFSSAMILNILQNVSNELLKQTDHFTQLSRSKLNERDDFNLFEAFCEECCVLLDNPEIISNLRIFLNVIYSAHLYKKFGIWFVQGPICRERDNPLQNRYTMAMPDIDSYEIDDQVQLKYAGRGFIYQSAQHDDFQLLRTPQPSFLRKFIGLGQVVPTG